MSTVKAWFKKDLNLQIHPHKTFFSASCGFLNQDLHLVWVLDDFLMTSWLLTLKQLEICQKCLKSIANYFTLKKYESQCLEYILQNWTWTFMQKIIMTMQRCEIAVLAQCTLICCVHFIYFFYDFELFRYFFLDVKNDHQ